MCGLVLVCVNDLWFFFFFQAEDGIRDVAVTGVQTCALPIYFVAAVGLEEKYDAVRQLIAIGKERGYLLYDEVNDSLPAEVHSSEEIDDLLTTFERNGIEIYEDQASAKAARAVEVSVESGDHEGVGKEDTHEGETDLDLTPGS